MNREQLLALLKEKGPEALTPEVYAKLDAGVLSEDTLKIIEAFAEKAADKRSKDLLARFDAVQAGQVSGNGNTDPRAMEYVYEDVPQSRLSANGAPGVMVKAPRIVRVGKDVEEMLAHMAACGRNGKNFRYNSSKDDEFKSDITEQDPSNAGLRMPMPFEEALVDSYLAAVPWLTRVRQIRGTGRRFWHPVRARDVKLSNRPKTLTTITARRIGEDATPIKTENTPWGYAEGKAVTYACYGRITQSQLRGNPGVVQDFMTELSRGISDIISYDAMYGAGDGSNEVLGFANQVDTRLKPVKNNRTTANRIKRADLLNVLENLHDIYTPNAFWMGRRQTIINLAREEDSQLRPIMDDVHRSITDGPDRTDLMGYPFVANWQAPPLGTEGDLMLVSPTGLWAFVQEALTIRSSDQVEFLQGALHIVADIGWNVGVVPELNDGLHILKA